MGAIEYKRVDIVIVMQNWEITAMTKQLCGHKLKIGDPLFVSEITKSLYKATDGTGIADALASSGSADTGHPVFGKYGLQWVALADLTDDLTEAGYFLAWVNRQQKRPVQRHRLSTGKNNTRLRYSFLRDPSLEENAQGCNLRLALKEYLASRLAENCFVWENPDGSATVNAVLRDTLERPRRIVDLTFDLEQGFTAQSVPNQDH